MTEENIKNPSGKYQKPILIFLGIVIVLGIISVTGLLVLGLKRPKELAKPTPTPTISSSTISPSPLVEVSPSPSPRVRLTLTPEPTVTFGPTVSPTSLPTPSLTPTPVKFETYKPPLRMMPRSETQTLTSTAALDGYRSSIDTGGTTAGIVAGRASTLADRGFVSFDLSTLPSGITVDKATLRLYQARITHNPYSACGNLLVDHLDFGTSLEGSDYNRTALAANIGTLANNLTLEWKEIEVTEGVKDDLTADRTRSQYRLQFASETLGGGTSGDFALFETGENYFGTGNLPQLVIIFRRS